MFSIWRGTDRTVSTPRRRAGGAFVAAFALNAALMAAFVGAIRRGYLLADVFGRDSLTAPVTERVAYVATLPNDPTRPPSEGQSGGDGRPVSERPSPARPPLRAPTTISDGLPAPAASVAPDDGGGSGAVVGEGGPTVGIRPNLGDPRLWARPGVAVVPRTPKQRADSVIADLFSPVRDSIARAQALAAGERAPGDWTFQGRGGKWGMDQNNIHLGKIKVPNAVLALLSEQFQRNLRGNPTEQEYARRLAAIRSDLEIHTQREMNEDSFRDAVKQLRARKDRERRQRLEEQRRTRDQQPAMAVDGSGESPPGIPAGAAPPR